jgi:putative oxidoreductase
MPEAAAWRAALPAVLIFSELELNSANDTKRNEPEERQVQIQKQIKATHALIDRHEWVAQLFVRLFVGYFFMETGWGKLHNLDGFAQRFAGWGIPYPYFNAALSAYTEFIGGLLTVCGIGTRLVSIPMIINMLVAILKVNVKHVTSLDDFVELDEPLYALAYLWLLLSGPGWVSIDYLVSRALGLTEPCGSRSPVGQTEGAGFEARSRLTPERIN